MEKRSVALLRADRCLECASRRLREANEELNAAEREHRIARELVESLEAAQSSRIALSANPNGEKHGT